MGNGTQVRAVYEEGVLKLLTPLDLPEGQQVRVVVLEESACQADRPQPHGLRSGRLTDQRSRKTDEEASARDEERHAVELAYPTQLVPAEKLDSLTGLVAVGGDAVADSEALYD